MQSFLHGQIERSHSVLEDEVDFDAIRREQAKVYAARQLLDLPELVIETMETEARRSQDD